MSDTLNEQPQNESPVPATPPAVDAPKTITSAAEFRRARERRDNGELVELASGMVMKVKRPAISQLVKTGQLPAELANAAVKVQSGAGTATEADYQKYIQYQERIIRLSVVEPQLVDSNPTDEQITMDDLSDVDKGEIVIYVNGGLDALAQFRLG